MTEIVSPPAAVEVRSLTRYYGQVKALDEVDLTIADGEYFVLLGPSGGGKTTLLRLIGGFIRPSSGSIFLHGSDVSGLPPDRRPTSMVFQSYALFPHMTVAQNVGYGLKLRKIPRDQAADDVAKALAQVSMSGYEDRKPWELSGGQQQRVQLARALVLQPRILLLDEPLAALDAKLRKDMCYELKHLQESVGITFIHVTHNQEEAMTVADRVAVVADGKLVEQGSTRTIYESPVKQFTADFIGERNVFSGAVVGAGGDGGIRIDLGFSEISLPQQSLPQPAEALQTNSKVVVSVRSECVSVSDKPPSGSGLITVPARIQEQVYLGLMTQSIARLDNGQIVNVRTMGADSIAYQPGDQVFLSWQAADTSLHTQ